MNRKEDQLLWEAYKSIYEEIDKEPYWGTSKQPYWYAGANHTVDLVVIHENNGSKKILLIKRGPNGAEPNKWAIPGGFVNTDAKPKSGEVFRPTEEPVDAAFREVQEETNLDLSQLKDRIKHIGTFEGDKRDPRDNQEAWSKSDAFALKITKEDNIDMTKARGMDDAVDAKWLDVSTVLKLISANKLAFDHGKIILKALKLYTSA